MNSPICWVGGKKLLREIIVDRFPAGYEKNTYAELFAGGAWVFFHKNRSQIEVINDFNHNLVNLYRCIRDQPEELIDALTPALNSREEFERIRLLLKNPVGLSEIERASCYYQQIKFSYAARLKSYGGRSCSLWSRFPEMKLAGQRLNGVVVENLDFEELIHRYDSPNTLFYADPPYVETESYYDNANFGQKDHERLANAAHALQGKILISYNACPIVYQLYATNQFMIEEMERLSNMAQRYEAGKMYAEYLISNYDTTEKLKQSNQISLFDNGRQGYEEIMKERKILWNPFQR